MKVEAIETIQNTLTTNTQQLNHPPPSPLPEMAILKQFGSPSLQKTSDLSANSIESSPRMDGVLPTTGVKVCLVVHDEKVLVLRRNDGVVKGSKPLFVIPTLHILSVSLRLAEKAPETIRLSYLSPAPAYTLLHLVLHPSPSLTSSLSVPEFVSLLNKSAYPTSTPTPTARRRILLLVNPVGGRGKARKMTEGTVLPALKAAGCHVETTYTTRNGHAKDVATELDPERYDVIGCVSGDGGIHEVLAGFAGRSDAKRCFRIPVVPVPAGSGNSLSLSIHGKIDGFSPHIATLNLIKGKQMVMDLCSLSQGDKPRIISFLSTALGLMADLDLGTENLRWMGDTRFVYGFLRATLSPPSWPGTISLLPASPAYADKQAHARDLRDRLEMSPEQVEADKERDVANLDEEDKDEDGPLPAVKFKGPEEDWITIGQGTGGVGKDGIMYAYAGLQSVASRDLMQWPFINQGQGLIDLVIQESASRAVMIKSVAGAEDGNQVWQPSQHYLKARALHVDPYGASNRLPKDPLPSQYISIDGESLNPADGPFTIECHQGLGRTLALRGRWEGAEDFWKKGCLDQSLKK
ncbi:Sphingosine kinase, involved in sphingolipid metabolism [Phaffia rhodozyma]|uniref:Sphingosine kinase, involved in sphingolipid metabolism n=1 Tax=Phaffia rhodozyma TaxID=264483 RepID=A0A0F7SIP0_PHARH|nr:Sphingosine kinase, involved in sphingolipid metabolism [Phaffia rhodozyma]